MLPVSEFFVAAKPHPLRTDVVRWTMPVGKSVEDALVECVTRTGVEPALLASSACVLVDRMVPKEDWASTRPKAGETLYVRALPDGDLGSILIQVATVALVALVPGGQFAAIAAKVAITVAGALISQALAPTPKQRGVGRDDPITARYTVQGIRNEMRPYGARPKVLGRVVKYAPPFAGTTYTEVLGGDNQALRAVFFVSEGPTQISNIEIGGTPVSNFKSAQVEIRNGHPTDPPLTLIPRQVREESLSIQLRAVNGFSERRTEPDTDRVTLDVLFPNGMGRVTDRNVKFGIVVVFEVQYSIAGAGVWNAAPLDGSLSAGVSFEGGGRFNVAGYSKSAIRRSVGFNVARGQYDVRVRRVTIDDQSDNTGDNQSTTFEDSFWTGVRSHYNASPINVTGVALIAVAIQATDQLNGQLDQLTCTAESLLPVWNGSSWVLQVSREPAWCYCEVLRGFPSNARPLADSRIDLPRMLEWAALNRAQGITFDGVISERSSVQDVLADIAGTANASPTVRTNGKYSVALDALKSEITQSFTNRNARDSQARRLWVRRPHALRVRYPDERTAPQWNEIIIYEDGYSVANATEFENLDLPYTTSATIAHRRARRAIKAARLRPWIYRRTVDVEHIFCERGDLVAMTDDVLFWGIDAARVRALTMSGADLVGIELDAPLPMQAGQSYSLRFRSVDGYIVAKVVTVAGLTAEFDLEAPITSGNPMPEVGDLAQFGVFGEESVRVIVRSIERGTDRSATMTFIDYVPEVYEVDNEPIPDYDANITLPPIVNRGLPPKPRIDSVTSDESVLISTGDGSFVSRILVRFSLRPEQSQIAAEVVQVRYRIKNLDLNWAYLPAVQASSTEVSIAPVEDGQLYEFGLRTVSQLGLASEWAEGEERVIGKTTPPPAVVELLREGENLVWQYPDPPRDFAGFRLRAHFGTLTNWGTSRPLHDGLISATSFPIGGLIGTQTILLKPVDSSGNESTAAAVLVLNLGDALVANLILTQDEDATSFPGVRAGCSLSGGDLLADVDASPPFWTSDQALFWTGDANPFWPGTTYQAMTYIATYEPVTDHIGAMVRLALTVTGEYQVDYRLNSTPPFWTGDSNAFWTGDGNAFWSPAILSEWRPWRGEIGPIVDDDTRFEIRVTVNGGRVQGVIDNFDILVDVPDVLEVLNNVAISALGTQLVPTKPFRFVKYVRLTAQGAYNASLRGGDYDLTTGLIVDCHSLSTGLAVTGNVDAELLGA
jgi:hypothetical protein